MIPGVGWAATYNRWAANYNVMNGCKLSLVDDCFAGYLQQGEKTIAHDAITNLAGAKLGSASVIDEMA